jgi:hypothetical protein
VAFEQKRKRQTCGTGTYDSDLRLHRWLWTLPPRAVRRRDASVRGP